MIMRIVLTGHLYVDLDAALQEVVKRLGQPKGDGTLKDGLITYRFEVTGETEPYDLFTENVLDYYSLCIWDKPTKDAALAQFHEERPEWANTFGPEKAAALLAWLRLKRWL